MLATLTHLLMICPGGPAGLKPMLLMTGPASRAANALSLELGRGLMLHMAKVPWLAKSLLWIVPDAACKLEDLVVRLQIEQSDVESKTSHQLHHRNAGRHC